MANDVPMWQVMGTVQRMRDLQRKTATGLTSAEGVELTALEVTVDIMVHDYLMPQPPTALELPPIPADFDAEADAWVRLTRPPEGGVS